MSIDYSIHGYAIVSDDDRVTRADGHSPQSLMNKEGWFYLQNALDESALSVLGRHTHEHYANLRRRKRLILSSSVKGLERKQDGWWWNPADMPWSEAAGIALPAGGRVAVVGGAYVNEVFLRKGFSAFHLARMHGVTVPGGRPLFLACDKGQSAESVLHDQGYRPEPAHVVDRIANVTLTIWRRPP